MRSWYAASFSRVGTEAVTWINRVYVHWSANAQPDFNQYIFTFDMIYKLEWMMLTFFVYIADNTLYNICWRGYLLLDVLEHIWRISVTVKSCFISHVWIELIKFYFHKYHRLHDIIIKWKHFPCYWPFVRGIHRSPVNSPDKGQWRGALMFSLICAWTNRWVNNRNAGDSRRHRVHYDVTVMLVMPLDCHDASETTWRIFVIKPHSSNRLYDIIRANKTKDKKAAYIFEGTYRWFSARLQ